MNTCVVLNVYQDRVVWIYRDKALRMVVLHTYSMQQSLSWEANRLAASQEIPRILWDPKIQYRIHKYKPPVPILILRSYRSIRPGPRLSL